MQDDPIFDEVFNDKAFEESGLAKGRRSNCHKCPIALACQDVLTMLDLFSGLGGFSVSAHRVGIRTVAFAEANPFCRKVLAKHWPEVPIFEDVKAVTAESLRARGIGPIGILAGGWPCQGNSVAGKRAGHADERSGLFSEILRLADELHPRWLLLENVPGLVSVNDGCDFADVIGSFGGAVTWDASGVWMHSTSDWPKDGHACSLSAVLEPQVSERFTLSSKAAAGILRRAERRGKSLPASLHEALRAVASEQTSTATED